MRYDVCFVGRLAYEKNIPRLLKILDELVLKKRNAQIVICGDGEYKNYLLEFIEDTIILLNNIDYKGFKLQNH
ncbi:MAG: glycosyltransferase [Thomasclavelia ramosa]